ncbi:Uncharacterized protein FKW44_016539, partial [Caligus rogercresseyi]
MRDGAQVPFLQPWDCHTKDNGPEQPHRRSTEAVDTRKKRDSYHGRVDILTTASYVTATAHGINDDWEIINSVLQTKELKVSHTAENLSQCLTDILDVYGVKRESVISVTTGNASNYVNAIEKHLEIVNIPCVAHTINLAVRKGLGVRVIEIPIARLKVAASHF